MVRRTQARQCDNADVRSRAVRREVNRVFQRFAIKPVGERYDSAVAYVEKHYPVD